MRRVGKWPVEVVIGYAAGPTGDGVAYAGLNRPSGREVMRIPFRVVRRSPLPERAIAYAALSTVARALSKRGITRASFVVPDGQCVEEVSRRSDLPEALVLPYVHLRCALNAFDDVNLRAGTTDELMQRARAEVALNHAA